MYLNSLKRYKKILLSLSYILNVIMDRYNSEEIIIRYSKFNKPKNKQYQILVRINHGI